MIAEGALRGLRVFEVGHALIERLIDLGDLQPGEMRRLQGLDLPARHRGIAGAAFFVGVLPAAIVILAVDDVSNRLGEQILDAIILGHGVVFTERIGANSMLIHSGIAAPAILGQRILPIEFIPLADQPVDAFVDRRPEFRRNLQFPMAEKAEHGESGHGGFKLFPLGAVFVLMRLQPIAEPP